MSITLLITHEYVTVNFLPFYATKLLKFKVQKFEANSVVRIVEYIVQQISAFKSQFCNVFFTKCLEFCPGKVLKTTVRCAVRTLLVYILLVNMNASCILTPFFTSEYLTYFYLSHVYVTHSVSTLCTFSTSLQSSVTCSTGCQCVNGYYTVNHKKT